MMSSRSPKIVGRRSPVNDARGAFTLIELMVVLVVGAVLIGVLYGILYTGTRVNRGTAAYGEAIQSAETTLAVLRRDLRRLVTLPVKKDADGEARHRYGDHDVPVRISPGGRHASFFVAEDSGEGPPPLDPTAQVVTWSLIPAPVGGTYRVRRTMGVLDGEDEVSPESADADEADGAGEDVGAASASAGGSGDEEEAPGGRTLAGVTVKDLRFRLLDPRAEDPEDRPPPGESSFFLETTVVGADTTGARTMTLKTLAALDFPATFQEPPHRNQNPVIAFAPRGALNVPAEVPNLTQEEFETLGRLRDLADRFERGDVEPEELEEEVRDTLQDLANDPGNVLLTPDGRPLGPVSEVNLVPGSGRNGRPVEFSTPGGSVFVPTTPGQVRTRLTEEFENPGGNGGGPFSPGGNMGVNFFATFREVQIVNGQVVNSRSHSTSGQINAVSRGAGNVQSVRNEAIGQARNEIDKFFQQYGLPGANF